MSLQAAVQAHELSSHRALARHDMLQALREAVGGRERLPDDVRTERVAARWNWRCRRWRLSGRSVERQLLLLVAGSIYMLASGLNVWPLVGIGSAVVGTSAAALWSVSSYFW